MKAVRATHSISLRSNGRSWHDPEHVVFTAALGLAYMVGLMAFQQYTGMLDIHNKTPTIVASMSLGQILVSQEAVHGSKMFDSDFHRHSRIVRHLMSFEEGKDTDLALVSSKPSSEVDSLNKSIECANGEEPKLKNGTEVCMPKKDPLFPPDIFTLDEIQNGAVVFYILGVIYMFVALAIVCDEFFVPALDVIIEKLGCSEDVAGATFMAAGGSAPELFTSIIGVFIAFSDVGIGTIVGSAVFNILFVIGMCALFSKTVLHLTWWPLLRDCTFYSVSLLTLIGFFVDNQIVWYEALGLLCIYFAYVAFMKINQHAERALKKLLSKNKVTRVRSTDHLVPSAGVTGAAMSGVVAGEPQKTHTGIPVLHAGSHFRHGLLQLMIHTIDPMHDGKVDEKATQLHAIASLKVLLDATKPQDGLNGTGSVGVPGVVDQAQDSGRASQGTEEGAQNTAGGGTGHSNPNQLEMEAEGEVQPEVLDMRFPIKGLEKQITYIVLFPIIFPLWLTLPDTRGERGKKFFYITFLGSIIWIAAFSYLMVWWATQTGNAFNIPPEVMGLTFLAAGTSIPDLITSVIVARKGFGDMAVSSSVGSNIFDVTVGLPMPWLLFTILFQKPVSVESTGMVCSIAILFGMLVLVFLSILIFNWKMTKGMGFSMFVFYFIFVLVSLGFEYNFYKCPI